MNTKIKNIMYNQLLNYSKTGYYLKVITIISVMISIVTMYLTDQSESTDDSRGWTYIWLFIFVIFIFLTMSSAIREKNMQKPITGFLYKTFIFFAFLFSLLFSIMSLSMVISSIGSEKFETTHLILSISIFVIALHSFRELFITKIYNKSL